jgi:uncharacterized membrane protein
LFFPLKISNLHRKSDMNTIIKSLLSLIAVIMPIAGTIAQSPSVKTDYLESSGKIYVVVAVIAVIFIGILALLISLERRLAKIEKEDKDI